MIREPLASPRGQGSDFDLAAQQLLEVRRRIEEFLAGRVAAAAAIDEGLATLWRITARSAEGGKLFRPALVMQAYLSYTGAAEVPESVMELATATELLHLAFLTHDDVIDNDTMRRGELNLLGSVEEIVGGPEFDDERGNRLGQAAAILVGDLLLSEAHLRVARIDQPHAVRLRVLDAIERALAVSVAGEFSDVSLSVRSDHPALAEVLSMSSNKTSAYTVLLPLELGLIAAGAESSVDARLIAQFSDAAGLAFQLQDDLFGVFGDQHKLGKAPYSDIREGKFTALIALACGTPVWGELESLLGDPMLSEADGAKARDLIDASGSRAAVEQELAAQFSRARAAARAVGASGREGERNLAEMLERLLMLLERRTS
ncbi:polyprenyl synthetase family protein [Pseudoclavibacter sp. AY1H1]|uniref:polyprenyl synthetase family protein n=1 Tax=Pseudoclavibacter sp. AY1H1 TaxID=2080584 RepID=UPI000CE7E458|nr:polyprenyl synthetase family protein [Pseudoclavibacter sp. AY1H1]PPF34067.1 geranylgeranyl pyrophosphate synthase [Pseudoclavibacter sp. AY1H1]